VLARTNATCGRIAGALEARGIKALVAEKGLRGTPEALLTRAGLAMLADPTDRLAAAEIAWFTGSAPNPSEWLSERITAYKKHRKDKTEDVAFAELPVLQALRELAKTADKLSPAEAVVAVFSAMNLPEQTLSWSDPYRHFANLEALRAVAADYQAICGARRSAATIAGLVQHLDGLSADHEQALPVVADAVRVLTYHKAKGLEWPVVVCAELDKAFDTSPFDVRVKPADDFDANNPLAGREIRWWPWPYGKKSTGLELKDKAAETDIAKLLAHQSKAENARLLYVGFTRARDHLVLSKFAAGRGGLRWLEMLEDAEGEPLLSLPWNDAGAQQITLGDHRFDCEVQSEVGTVSLTNVQHEQQVSWFARPESKTERKRQRLSPSAQVLSSQLAAQVRIAEVVNIGAHTALAVRAEQMAQVGETLHGFLAADLGPGSDGRKELAERLIKHWGLDGQLAVSTLIEMADRFRTWVDSHAPGVRLPEWPVRWLREDGRAMSGDIDLLVPLESGWLLLDHKSFPGGREDRDAKLVKWAGQLDAYRGAVEAATGQPVTELWVHLPVRGEVVRLEIPRAG
jgi:ATP-dependent exoDNAse (exonuclease V) beta subunit